MPGTGARCPLSVGASRWLYALGTATPGPLDIPQVPARHGCSNVQQLKGHAAALDVSQARAFGRSMLLSTSHAMRLAYGHRRSLDAPD
jgi:hypothetical protein